MTREPGSFLRELRDRKVVRATAAYGALVFVLWQVADFVLPALGLGDRAVSVLVVLTVASFPVVVALAWMLDVTAAGIRVAAPGSARHRALLAGVGLGAAGLAGITAWIGLARLSPPSVAEAEVRTWAIPAADDSLKAIAVLPFEDLSADTTDAYFAAGITEEITNQLTRVAELRVMSRTAVQRLVAEGAGPPELARMLRIGTVLAGSVRRAGDRVRVSAQLVDVATQAHLWAADFDRQMADVFAVQSEVALAIAEALHVRLSPDEARRIGSLPQASPAAWELYQQLRPMPGNSPETWAARASLLSQVVALDSTFALAWGELARAHLWQANFGRRVYLDSARAAGRRALSLDPEEATALHVMGLTYQLEHRPSESRRELIRVQSVAPGNPGFLLDLGITEELLGNYPESLYWSYRGYLLNPTHVNDRYHVAIGLVGLGEVELTRAWLATSLEMNPDFHRTHILQALFDVREGRVREAADRIRELYRRQPGRYEVELMWADLALLTDRDEARRVLEGLLARSPDGHAQWVFERTLRTNLAFLLREGGEPERAEPLFRQSLEAYERVWNEGGRARYVPMELAAIHAVHGRDEEAYRWLERGHAGGYRIAPLLAIDPMFESLRGQPRFEALLETMRGELAAMLEQARRERIGPFGEGG